MARSNGAAAEQAVHRAQATAEGVTATGTVTFRGRQFRLGPSDSIAPMLDFAEAAQKGLDTDDPAGMAAMKDMIRDCFVLHPSCGDCEACTAERYDDCPQLDPGDFAKFWRLVKAVRPGGEELMEVVQTAIEQATARPTGARSGSSSPARSPSGNSKGPSSSPGRIPPELAALPPAELVHAADILR